MKLNLTIRFFFNNFFNRVTFKIKDFYSFLGFWYFLVFVRNKILLIAEALNKRIRTIKVYVYYKISLAINFVIQSSISGIYYCFLGIGLN